MLFDVVLHCQPVVDGSSNKLKPGTSAKDAVVLVTNPFTTLKAANILAAPGGSYEHSVKIKSFKMVRRGMKRSRAVSNRRFKDRIYDQIGEHGTRMYHNETSGNSITVPEGRCVYTSLLSAGTFTDFQTIINASGTQNASSLGFNALGSHYDYYIKNYQTKVHIRNCELHPIFVTLYECSSKVPLTTVTDYTSMGAAAIGDLVAGFTDPVETGTLTSTTKPGDKSIEYSTFDTFFNSYLQHMKYRSFRKFNQRWRLLKSKSFKLNPGDDLFYNLDIGTKFMKPDQWVERTAPNLPIAVKPGCSKVLLAKFSSTMGESASTAGNYATMKSAVPWTTVTTAQVVLMNQKRQQSHHIAVHDAILTDYVGPGEHVLAADNP